MKSTWFPAYNSIIIISLIQQLLMTLLIRHVQALHFCSNPTSWKSSIYCSLRSSYDRQLKLHVTSNAFSFNNGPHQNSRRLRSSSSRNNNNICRYMTSTSVTNDFELLLDNVNENDYSIEKLQERMKYYVSTCKQATGSSSSRQRLVVMLSGGGGHFISTLSSTSGASSILLEGSNYYDRESYRQIVKLHKRLQLAHHNKDNMKFQYCSHDATSYLTDTALKRAIVLSAIDFSKKEMRVISQDIDSSPGSSSSRSSSFIDDNRSTTRNGELFNYLLSSPCGVACTSALFTTEGQDGKPVRSNRASRAHIGINTASGIKISLSLKLALPNRNDNEEYNGAVTTISSKQLLRSRFDEDVIVSHWILNCLQLTNMNQEELKSIFKLHNPKINMDGCNSYVMETTTVEGDEIHIKIQDPMLDDDVLVEDDMKSSNNDKVFLEAAERILSGINQTAMLIPTTTQLSGNNNIDDCSFQLLTTTVLPPRSLLVPGSFNPPHKGHILLAKNAADTTGSTSVWFELSITNADKPPLEAQEVLKRLSYFVKMYQDEYKNNTNDTSSMPSNWGIILTDAPLFKQKVDLLAPLLAHGDMEEKHNTRSSLLHFCIGTDTLIRLVDNKYYSNSEEQMMDMLINQMPCHFVVGGRLEQKKSAINTDDAKFITGVEHLNRLPDALRQKFTLLPNFRVDTSSSEIRQKLEEESSR